MDTPLAEEGLTGIAIGAAPVRLYLIQTHIRADFALLAMQNQIVNLGGEVQVHVRRPLRGPDDDPHDRRAELGPGRAALADLQSLLAHVPGLVVIMPATAVSILSSYPALIRSHKGPVLSSSTACLTIGFRVDVRRRVPSARRRRPAQAAFGKDVTVDRDVDHGPRGAARRSTSRRSAPPTSS